MESKHEIPIIFSNALTTVLATKKLDLNLARTKNIKDAWLLRESSIPGLLALRSALLRK